eukprot:2075576-Prymnesium_polylepis.1
MQMGSLCRGASGTTTLARCARTMPARGGVALNLEVRPGTLLNECRNSASAMLRGTLTPSGWASRSTARQAPSQQVVVYTTCG